MKKIVLNIVKKLGYSLVKIDSQEKYKDIQNIEFWELYYFCKPYTMTSIERMYSLYCSVDYILSKGLDGDFVECGVWRGGSSMLIAKMLFNRKIFDRKIFLYDTYEGMSAPTDLDITFSGEEAKNLLDTNVDNKEESLWCLADLNDVKKNLKSTKFPESNLVYIKGKVEDTLPDNVPNGKIALLRLDTDWYESTKHELNILFPMLAENGVLIIDDYGHWNGCRKAVDEYFEQNQFPILMNRIDYTGRMIIKNFC
jgi:O-methyltransferase